MNASIKSVDNDQEVSENARVEEKGPSSNSINTAASSLSDIITKNVNDLDAERLRAALEVLRTPDPGSVMDTVNISVDLSADNRLSQAPSKETVPSDKGGTRFMIFLLHCS